LTHGAKDKTSSVFSKIPDPVLSLFAYGGSTGHGKRSREIQNFLDECGSLPLLLMG